MMIDRPERKSTRLRGFDYSSDGAYFITLTTARREPWFGNIENVVMVTSQVGEIASRCWREIPEHFPNVALDAFVIMPDHVHGIIILNNQTCRDVQLSIPSDPRSTPKETADDYFARISPKRGSLAVVLRTYKAAVTTHCRRVGVGEFAWQSGYYDHIIRDQKSLSRIRAYILQNPECWSKRKRRK